TVDVKHDPGRIQLLGPGVSNGSVDINVSADVDGGAALKVQGDLAADLEVAVDVDRRPVRYRQRQTRTLQIQILADVDDLSIEPVRTAEVATNHLDRSRTDIHARNRPTGHVRHGKVYPFVTVRRMVSVVWVLAQIHQIRDRKSVV